MFEQNDVEMPTTWSQTATNIVASKYFHGTVGSKARERSLSQLVHRVVDTVAEWGASGGYFRSGEDAESFRDDLAHLMLAQKASFNSPVWFNVGVLKESRGYGWAWSHETGRATALNPDEHRPQCSACFINSVEDSLESILDLVKTEGMLFKWGSGTGTNLSKIREDDAGLAGGGRASGPVSFMKGFDAFAGVIKSGGKTRRAAKMVILNIDHPDVKEFVWCKAREEGKAHVLIENGYDGAIDGDAYSTISFQNANNSVRVSDEFMQAAEQGRGLVDALGAQPAAQGAAPRPGAPEGDRGGDAPVRRSRDCSSIRRSTSGIPSRRRPGSTLRIRARSTCSSTTPPAIWPR